MEQIFIKNLAVKVHVGVTEKERKKSQLLLVSIEATPINKYSNIRDVLENTIDYSSIRSSVKTLLKNSRFHLIETIAGEIAHLIKNTYSVRNLTVTVKKFPYKDTEWVGYRLSL